MCGIGHGAWSDPGASFVLSPILLTTHIVPGASFVLSPILSTTHIVPGASFVLSPILLTTHIDQHDHKEGQLHPRLLVTCTETFSSVPLAAGKQPTSPLSTLL